MDAEIQKIAALIHKRLNNADVILFGSYAYGSPRIDSDLDICIVADTMKSKIEIMREIRHETIKFQTRPLDLLVYRKDEFKEKSFTQNGLEKVINEKGIRIDG